MNDHENVITRVTRRGLILGGLATAGLAATGGSAALAKPRQHRVRQPRVLVATNEPWGTYHVSPLLAEAARQVAPGRPPLVRVARAGR